MGVAPTADEVPLRMTRLCRRERSRGWRPWRRGRFRGQQAARRGASATKNGGDPGGIAAVSCVTWLASGADRRSAERVVAAEDRHSVLRDLQMRGRGGQRVERDRPVLAPAASTTDLL